MSRREMRIIIGFLFVVFSTVNSIAQSDGDFRSNGTGNWSTLGTWEERISGSWQAATHSPTSADGAIEIQVGHTVTANASVTVDELTVNGSLTLNDGSIFTSITLTILDGAGTDLTNNGTITLADALGFIGTILVNNGTFVNTATVTINAPLISSITMAANSTYNHNQNGGTIPTATWNTTSTCTVTGVTSSVPSGIGQAFGNFDWNCGSQNPGLSLAMSGSSTTIAGDFDITSTNGAIFFLSTAETGVVLAITGSFNISNPSFVVFTNTGDITFNVDTDFTYSSLLPSFFAATGTAILNVDGDFSHISGSLGLSGAGTATINFNGSGVQSFRDGGTFSVIDFVVANSSILDLGTSAVSGTGDFSLSAAAELRVGSTHASGAIQAGTSNGNIRVSGSRTYNSSSTIVYNGASAQALGDGFPSDVNLSIDNASGVSFSGILAIGSVNTLTLTSGFLSIGTNELQITGTVSGTGSISGGSTSDLTIGGIGALGTINFTSGSRSLQNFTLNRASSGTVTLGTDLEIVNGGTLTQTLGDLIINDVSLTITGIFSKAAGNFTSNNNSTLILQGSGTIDAISFSGGSQLQTLTVDNSNGASTGSGLTIATNLNLTSGAFGGAGSLTMGTGSTIIRAEGSTSKTISATTTYNVTYQSSGALSPGGELPTNVTDLNTLTNNGNVVTLGNNVTINGDLILTNGTLDASTNNVTFDAPGGGSNFTANGGNFSINAANTVTFDGGSTTMSGANIGGTQFGNLTVATGATLSAPNANINISATWSNQGTLIPNSGTITFNGASQNIDTNGQPFNNVDFAGTSTKTLQDALDVNGDVTISSTLSAGTNSITAGGNWDSGSGTFTAGSSLVTLDGAAQNITLGGSNAFNDLTIAGTSTKTMQDELDIDGDLIISSTLSAGADNNILIVGDWTNNGTFSAASGLVTFDGNGTSNVLGSSNTQFNDINTIGSTTIVEIETTHSMTGTLTLAGSSTFDADGGTDVGVFTLISSADDPTVDGNVANIPGTATYRGATTVQRYMSSEGGVWRYITTPVSGLTVADWQVEFPITGSFTGADDLGGANKASLYNYNEPTAGVIDLGWNAYPVTTNTETIDPGVGYSAFMRASGGQITIDQRGPINQGNFDYTSAGNLSYTNNGSAPDDGWNILGNPYPSSIDWDLMWNNEGTPNLDGTIYIRDNPSSIFATWNASTSSGTNGGTKNIATGQAFWVHATAAPALTLNESEKTTDSHEFFRIAPPSNFIRIALSDGVDKDETLIHFFDDALPGKDKYDAYKLQNDIFNLSTLMEDGTELVINALSSITCDSEVSIKISEVSVGNYTLDFSELDSFDDVVSIYLTDHFTGISQNLIENSSYVFGVTADTLSFGNDRFNVSFSQQINTDIPVSNVDNICDLSDFLITIDNTQKAVAYQAFLNDLPISEIVDGNGSSVYLNVNSSDLLFGDNSLIVIANRENCNSAPLNQNISIFKSENPSVSAVKNGSNCGKGTVKLQVSGASNNGFYRWYDTINSIDPIIETSDSTFETPIISNSRDYFVAVVNDLGCEGERVMVAATIDQIFEVVTVNGGKICKEGSVTLTGTGAPIGGSYRWYNSSNELLQGSDSIFETASLLSSEIFYVSIISPEGCEGPTVEVLAEVVNVENPVITIQDDRLNSSSAEGNQWYIDGNLIQGAVAQTYLPTESGFYTVEVTISGCTAISADVEYLITGISELDDSNAVKIFPNPANGAINIEYNSSSNQDITIIIFDLSGKRMKEYKGLNTIDGKYRISTSDFEDGVYIIQLLDGDKYHINRVIINN